MVKYKALLGEKFDKSKITVVGSPTITSDGVASGFSRDNYVIANCNSLINATNYEINLAFTFNEMLSTSEYDYLFADSLGASYGLSLWRLYNSLQIRCNAEHLIIVSNVSINTLYNVKISVANGICKVYTTVNGVTTEKSMDISTIQAWSGLIWLGTRYGDASSSRFRGSINIKQFKIYVDNQLVFQPVKPTHLLERRKPTVWNKGQFTVVGNPSISESGWASGFSSGNYIKQNISLQGVYTLKGEITIGTINEQNIPLGVNANNTLLLSLRVDSSNSRMVLVAKNTSGNNTALYTSNNFIASGNKYSFEIVVDGSSLTFKLNNSIVGTMSNFDNIETQFITLGVDRAFTFPFTGSINLKQFKIYTDNTLVFDGGAETYVYDPSKFTIVGSPTITEYGVASGFSGSNYIKIGEVIQPNNNFKAKIKIKTSTLPDTGHYHFINANYSIAGFSMKIDANGKRFVCYLTSDGQTNDIGTLIIPMDVSNNTDYWLNLSWDGQKYEFSCSTDGINFSNKIIKESNLPIYTQNRVYSLGGASYPFTCGSIDLSQFSITVDNKEVFTGAKENYYMLNGI